MHKVALALLIAGSLVLLPRVSPASPEIILPDCNGQHVVRPNIINVSCAADGNGDINNLHWQHWGEHHATAKGILFRETCEPNCGQGMHTLTPVIITTTGHQDCNGTPAYAGYYIKNDTSQRTLTTQELPVQLHSYARTFQSDLEYYATPCNGMH